MSQRSGKKSFGKGLLVDPFITQTGEYSVETVKSLVAHYRAGILGITPLFFDLSGDIRNAMPDQPASSELKFVPTDSPYSGGAFDKKARLGSLNFNDGINNGLVVTKDPSVFSFSDGTADRPFSVSFS